MESLGKRMEAYIRRHNLWQSGDRLLIGLSGGVDSMVLASLCLESGYPIALAHCNFKLRGAESDRDEKFVRDWAEKNKILLFVKEFDTKGESDKRKTAIEETARSLRYEWFQELMGANGFHKLLTAHHADDNLETVLMHFFRGTGIRGLRGILPIHEKIVRPLLFARRVEIEQYAQEKAIPYVVDSTNADTQYTRNYFRHAIIPAITKTFPEAEKNILQGIDHWREAEELYRQAVDRHLKKLCVVKGNEIHIPVLLMKKTRPVSTLLWEIVRPFGFSARQMPDLLNLLDAGPGKYVASETHRLIQNRQWLILAPIPGEEAGHILIEGEGDYIYPEGTIRIRKQKSGDIQFEKISDAHGIPGLEKKIELTEKQMEWPLLLRRWKAGDYFFPQGMKGKKKKIARYLIDRKLSKTEKEKVWVLESDRKILWVVG